MSDLIRSPVYLQVESSSLTTNVWQRIRKADNIASCLHHGRAFQGA